MSDPQVSYSETTLKIDDNTVEAEYPIVETLVHDELVIILTEPPSGIDVRDNVLAYDFNGGKQWSISPVTTEERDTSVTYVGLDEYNGKILAHNWNGGTYEVDPETGEIGIHGWSK